MNKRKLWPLLLLFSSGSAAAETKFAGYLKSFAVVQDSIDSPYLQADRLFESRNSLRLMWQVFSGHTIWQLHYEITPVLSSHPVAYTGAGLTGTNTWRLTDIEPSLTSNPKREVYQNLDRFNVQFRFRAGDLTIGRQPITFGTARVINPTDVFLPFDVRTLNREYRVGVDAIRFQHPFGQLSELDVGVIAGDDARTDTSSAFLQVKTNVNGNDLQLALIRYAGQTLAGGGVQTALGNFGFWFEGAAVWGDENYQRVSTGLDYAFTENVYGLIEYHYNGAGESREQDYPVNVTRAPYRVGGVFLLGRQYIIPSVNVQLSPLWTVTAQALANLSDGSVFLSLATTCNITENAYVDLGYYHFLGNRLSEYGADPDTLYASIRYYF
ncbi:MAG TPA: hypothetical protein VJ998_04985 [Pseudomonadales bacterium]|nr:hypothetical protein [Pseudomonadales bacterium]